MSEEKDQEYKRGSFAEKKGEIIIRDHVYDGIQEYDQNLPNWWLFAFYIAIAWYLIHWGFYYNVGRSMTDHEKVVQGMTEVDHKRQDALAATLATLSNDTLIDKWANDPSIVGAGQAIFRANCVPCHGIDLSATMDVGGKRIPLPGLPITDGEWKFGGEPMQIFKLVNEGSPPESDGNNGAKMQAWGQTFSPKQVAEVVAYVISQVPDFKDRIKGKGDE